MEISVRHIGDVVVIDLAGRLDSTTVRGVQDKVLEYISPGSPVLLNMRDVAYMSSAGLRMLLLLERTITKEHGRVVLAELSEKLQDVMSMTGFLRFFTHGETFEDALAMLTS